MGALTLEHIQHCFIYVVTKYFDGLYYLNDGISSSNLCDCLSAEKKIAIANF